MSELARGEWGPPDAPPVVAIHGITSNHLAFAAVAAALPEFHLVAPDLRGRGRSSELPGPWGLARHAADVAALIDELGGRAIVLGHSMGGFVAVELARRHPDQVGGLVLLDGGLPLRLPPEMSMAEARSAGLGPAMARLSMRFATRAAYRDFWRSHPALAADWGPLLERYVDYDLVGDPPELRSSVSLAAVTQDHAEQFEPPADGDLFGAYAGPSRLLVVGKGLNGAPPGLYDEADLPYWRDRAPQLVIEHLPDLNHYTLVFHSAGAARIAEVVRSLAPERPRSL